MGEALVTGRSIGSASGGNGYVFITEIITQDKVWVAPAAQNQQFSVRIFGGGGGGTYGAGGGGGWMNNDILAINEGDLVPISVGSGGLGGSIVSGSGGSSMFGGYLSANGGEGASWTSNNYSKAKGGNGGSGGGGAGGTGGGGGTGYQFGGGGGCLYSGNGGIWGGNGGGRYASASTNGTNTLGMDNIPVGYKGAGLSRYPGNEYYGSGGYGGNGGCNAYSGGGGYGANGGNGYSSNSGTCCPGGGGGYGCAGKGGDGILNASYSNAYGAGGGGAYGRGGDAFNTTIGFANRDGLYGGGGGGGYGNINNITIFGNGGDGICIIQYYKAIQQNSFTMYQ